MASLVDYKGLSVLDSASGDGGAAINDDLMGLADRIGPCNYGASTNPTVDNDSADTAGIGIKFYVGSRWIHGTLIFDCVADTPGAAVWVTSTATGPFLPLSGGTMTGALAMGGNNLNLNNGSGSGGASLNLDSGQLIFGSGGQLQDNGLGGILVNASLQMQNNVMWATGGVQFFSGATISAASPSGLNINLSNAYMNGGNIHLNDGSGSGGGTLSADNGVITNLQLAQLSPQGSAPAAIAGGIYFSGSHFYCCKDGSTWTLLS